VTLLAFTTGALLLLAASALFHKPTIDRRLAALTPGDEGDDEMYAPQTPLLERLMRPFAAATGERKDASSIREKLLSAGYGSEAAYTNYTGSRLALPVVFALAGFAGATALGLEQTQQISVAGAGLCMGFLGPGFWLDKKRKARQTEVRQKLPDVLDLLIVCLEAGLSLGAALARVASELSRSSPVLSTELRLVNAEMQAGKTSMEALRGLSDRIGITEVSSLVAMLIQTERFGTSVSDALRVHTEGMRTERLQNAEEVAQKASVKMIFPTLVFIFPSTILIALGPGVLEALGTLKDL
jgi:tight adherence protein C